MKTAMAQVPEWRKAWKLDDPEWVKRRKAEWKRLRQHPIIGDWYKGDELKAIKNFFMTGMPENPEPPEEDWEWLRYDPDLPLRGVDGSVGWPRSHPRQRASSRSRKIGNCISSDAAKQLLEFLRDTDLPEGLASYFGRLFHNGRIPDQPTWSIIFNS